MDLIHGVRRQLYADHCKRPRGDRIADTEKELDPRGSCGTTGGNDNKRQISSCSGREEAKVSSRSSCAYVRDDQSLYPLYCGLVVGVTIHARRKFVFPMCVCVCGDDSLRIVCDTTIVDGQEKSSLVQVADWRRQDCAYACEFC